MVVGLLKKLFILILAVLTMISGCNIDSDWKEKVRMKQKLDNPLSSWLAIDDVTGGQIIRPQSDYIWKDQHDNNVFLNSEGPLQIIKNNEKYFSSGQLGSAHVEKLHSYQIVNFNKVLKDVFGIESKMSDIYHLRVFSADNFAYDLNIYSELGAAKYISVCIDYCWESKPKLIFVSRKKHE
jgi:hypothetical protein